MISDNIPAFLKSILEGNRPVQFSLSEISGTAVENVTSSFYYDAVNEPLKSTQQLNVDWSRFDRHTFFSSAAANVNVAFDKMINGFPFDGTQQELELFLSKLTGFEKYIFENFPRYRGQLMFSGTQVGENGANGTFIRVNDRAGGLYPELSKNKSGDNVLDPKENPLTIEMQLFIPQSNVIGKQVIVQKSNGNNGFSLLLSASSSDPISTFIVYSGSNYVSASCQLERGKFNHICVTYHNDVPTRHVSFFKDEKLVSTSNQVIINNLELGKANLVIGSGSSINTMNFAYVPDQTFSGSMDELRIFHAERTVTQQSAYAKKSIHATSDLKLYYRFNEPPPPLSTDGSVDSIVLDSSGNSLHATISNFSSNLRVSAENSLNPVIYESKLTTPILFPGYNDVIQLNQRLLTSASEYDETNPNLITRLIPQHYLLEGQAFDAQSTTEGNLSNEEYQGKSIPGSGQLGSAQIMLTFLYTWAKFFDDIKLFVDHFSSIDFIDYEINETSPNNFLERLLQKFGFNLPKQFFSDSTLEQYVDGSNIDFETSINENTLKYIQTQLMRRLLNELQTIIRSKGTLQSIKTFFRSLGIDPDTNLRIREHGGPTDRQLTFARDKKTEIKPMLAFSGSSYVNSPYLVNDRVEPGYPYASLTPNDDILTSGSWTVEGVVKYLANSLTFLRGDQSICRLMVTGSNASFGGIVTNLVATKTDDDAILNLYVRPGTDAVNSPLQTLTLNVPNFFNVEYDKWNFAFGRFRNDEIGSNVSSSYFLRAACQNFGEILSYVTTSSFFYEIAGSEPNAFSAYEMINNSNVSGCYIAIGSQSLPIGTSGAGYAFLNSSDIAPTGSRSTFFDGMLSNLRFWSYGVSDDEWKEHVRNHNSTGVEDPLVNYDYVTTRSGSFQRLRLDVVNMQDDTSSDSSGNLTLIDYSGQNFHMTGTMFPTSSAAFTPQFFSYSRLSPYFDEAASDMKVRVRGYQDQELVDSIPWAQTGPVYEIPRNERPTDDVRFSVELSLIDALNNDIVNLFSTYEFLDNAIGKPELMFSPDYPDIETLREIYFNRMTEKLNFKAFFEFYRWLDLTTLNFLEQLIPKKTLFKGVNFTIESHMLERHKVEYKNVDKLKLAVTNISGKI